MKIYERHFNNQIARTDEATYWTFPFPSEARITKLVFVQTGGPTVGAGALTVKCFNSKKVIESGSMSSGGAEVEENEAFSPDLYQVFEAMKNDGVEDGPGVFKRFFGDNTPKVFVNQDGGFTNKEKKLYIQVVIEGGGGEDTSWDVALGGITDIS